MNFPSVEPLLSSFGITPKDVSLYEMALTHSSVNGSANTNHHDYERLEFLGDSLVGLVVGELCFLYHPEMEEGDLSKLKAQFIQTDSEASYGLALGLDKYVRVGPSFKGDVKINHPLLEDVFEAFIGAMFLDQGKDKAYEFVRNVYEKDVAGAVVEEKKNPIGELNEAVQADLAKPVSFHEISEEGPSNERYYVFSVVFDGNEYGRGGGKSKDAAKAAAASEALKKLAHHNEELSDLSKEDLFSLFLNANPEWRK
ncbi:MAG: ribonuclease III [Bacilli bacterium]|jgi:ribonuclease-3|nr:ribonuclease III [Bacilli bacterium]MCI2054838.1 ribonuclease III [Bacilli bacterium]